MNAAEMNAKCVERCRQIAAVHSNLSIREGAIQCADAIAAIPVEADPRDAEIAALRREMNTMRGVLDLYLERTNRLERIAQDNAK